MEREVITVAKEYVNADTLIGEIVVQYPDAVDVLYECGMHCIGCPASQMESLAEACMVHGLEPDGVVEALNNRIEELKAE